MFGIGGDDTDHYQVGCKGLGARKMLMSSAGKFSCTFWNIVNMNSPFLCTRFVTICCFRLIHQVEGECAVRYPKCQYIRTQYTFSKDMNATVCEHDVPKSSVKINLSKAWQQQPSRQMRHVTMRIHEKLPPVALTECNLLNATVSGESTCSYLVNVRWTTKRRLLHLSHSSLQLSETTHQYRKHKW